MLWLKLATRNTLRQRWRTALPVAGLVIGVVSLLFAWAVFDGLNTRLVTNMTAMHSGHLQILRNRQLEEPRLEHAFSLDEVRTSIAHPDIKASAPRLTSTALIASDLRARGVLVIGVDPMKERAITVLSERVVQGHYLQPQLNDGILLGAALARALSVHLGDEVALISEGLHGAIGAQPFRVIGVYDTGNDSIDAGQVFITLDAAQQLFSAPQRVTSVALRLNSLDLAPAVAAELANSALPASHRIWGWRELMPPVAQSVDFHEAVMRSIMALLFLVVALGVACSLQVSIAQRVREFGTLLAIGVGPFQLVRLILYEVACLVAVALIVSCVVTIPLVAWFGQRGIEFSEHTQAMQSMSGGWSVIRPELHLARLLEVAIGLMSVAVLAALLPSLKIARLNPVQALGGTWRQPTSRPYLSGQESKMSAWPPSLRMAARSISRMPGRSGLLIASLSLGLAAFIFASAVSEGFVGLMVRNATGLLSGDVQLRLEQAVGDTLPVPVFDAAPDWLAQLGRRLPSVIGISPRVQVQATLGSPRKAEPVILVGMDKSTDHAGFALARAIGQGAYLTHERDMLIGRKLAERLDVRVGEKVVATVQNASGDLAFDAFRIAGLFDTGSHSEDAAIAFVHLDSAQRLLGLRPNQVTQVLLHQDAHARVRPVEAAEAAAFEVSRHLPIGAGLEAKSWPQLMPDTAKFARLVRQGLALVLYVVLAMVAVTVGNSLLMSVLERRREFGTLLAIGAKDVAVVRMVLTEGLLLAILGIAGGGALGVGAVAVVSATGIDLAVRGAEATAGTSQVVHPILSLPMLLWPSLLLLVVVLMASAYPAARAVRLDPVQALRSSP